MQTTLPWFGKTPPSTPAESASLDSRVIYYLGSKQRILRSIVEAVSEVAPSGARVCDLFAGSGAVSRALAADWVVTGVDIQEYSRVLTNAALNPTDISHPAWDTVVSRARVSQLRSTLTQSLSGLLRYELLALQQARDKDATQLAGLCDAAPLETVGERLSEVHDAVLDLIGESYKRLVSEGLGRGADTVITRYYGGVYFTWQQAIDLDCLLAEIHRYSGTVRDSLLAAAFGTASEAVNTIGKHFAQPLQLKSTSGEIKRHLVAQSLRDRSVDVFATYGTFRDRLGRNGWVRRGHRAVRSDYREFLANPSEVFDAVYADPPYTRDHYSRFYHILETMALHDEPSVSSTLIRSSRRRPSRGIYRVERHQSPFCIQSLAEGALDDLGRMVASRSVPLILSYSPYSSVAGNRPRLMSLEIVTEVMRRHFARIRVRSVDGLSHSKFNRRDRNVTVDYPAEALLVCEPSAASS